MTKCQGEGLKAGCEVQRGMMEEMRVGKPAFVDSDSNEHEEPQGLEQGPRYEHEAE